MSKIEALGCWIVDKVHWFLFLNVIVSFEAADIAHVYLNLSLVKQLI